MFTLGPFEGSKKQLWCAIYYQQVKRQFTSNLKSKLVIEYYLQYSKETKISDFWYMIGLRLIDCLIKF